MIWEGLQKAIDLYFEKQALQVDSFHFRLDEIGMFEIVL